MQSKLNHVPARSAASTPTSAATRRVAPAAAVPAAVRRNVAAAAATGGAATSVAAMSSQMRAVRSKMEEDEQLRVLMAGFRGANLNEDDFANSNVRMELIETDSDSDHQLVRGVLQIWRLFRRSKRRGVMRYKEMVQGK